MCYDNCSCYYCRITKLEEQNKVLKQLSDKQKEAINLMQTMLDKRDATIKTKDGIIELSDDIITLLQDKVKRLNRYLDWMVFW